MGERSKTKQFKAGIQNADDILFLLTGSRFKDVIGNTVSTFGEELTRKLTGVFTGIDELRMSPDSPYSVLGIHPNALDVVVRGAYRALAREYHPDTGLKPDPAKFQKVTEAYDAIMKERQAKPE